MYRPTRGQCYIKSLQKRRETRAGGREGTGTDTSRDAENKIVKQRMGGGKDRRFRRNIERGTKARRDS